MEDAEILRRIRIIWIKTFAAMGPHTGTQLAGVGWSYELSCGKPALGR